MKTITQEDLNERIIRHEKWLRGEKGGKRLKLKNYDLSEKKFTDINLSKAVLKNCDLSYCIFTNANLSNANLSQSMLDYVEFNYVDFTHTILYDTYWCGTEENNSNLDCAILM